jgi:TonB family protein
MIPVSNPTRTFPLFLVLICLAHLPELARGQAGVLSHFVAPAYPALARQAMISGQVVLRLAIGADGKVLDLKEEASAHQLLAQEAKAAVRQWEFQPRARQQSASVTVFFGFSGTTRESNPATVVKADFAGSTVRVYVNTDGVPTVRAVKDNQFDAEGVSLLPATPGRIVQEIGDASSLCELFVQPESRSRQTIRIRAELVTSRHAWLLAPVPPCREPIYTSGGRNWSKWLLFRTSETASPQSSVETDVVSRRKFEALFSFLDRHSSQDIGARIIVTLEGEFRFIASRAPGFDLKGPLVAEFIVHKYLATDISQRLAGPSQEPE